MKRVVLKIGTKVLSRDDGTLDTELLSVFVEQVALMRAQGVEVVLVTSGAVGAGKSLIHLHDRLSDVVRKQVYAAVGQVKLMSTYADMFAQHKLLCAQVLATKEDFRDDEHYQNMKNCFEGLLVDGVVPIVNENDVVATTELLFTDNDELAGLVAKQLRADTLIILTGTHGILDREGTTVQEVSSANIDEVQSCISADTSTGGRGGMTSKFKTACELSAQGTVVWIVNGKDRDVLSNLSQGLFRGTKFV